MTPFTAQFRILAVGHNSKSKSELWLYVAPSCDASRQVIRDHQGYRGSYNDRIVCVLSMSYKALHKHFLAQGINITLLSGSNWMTNGGIIDAFSSQAIELTVNDFKVRRSYPKYSHGYRRLTFICSIK
jgi:hypothetical protein